jgi:hypothetical protein
LGLLGYFYNLLLAALLTAPLAAQSVEIHTEFQRVDPFGQIVAIDRSDYPREILSPEVPRNAHTYFNVSVTVPPNTSYFLYVGSNPAQLIETTLYKEEFERVGDAWIPDALLPLRSPAFGFMPDAEARIPGQTTRCYLLDIWVPYNADVRRVRVEVLLKIGIWYVAPMEVRIGQARVPARSALHGPFSMRDAVLPDAGERIDSAAVECLASYLLGGPPTWHPEVGSVREAVRLSAEQDMAIARLNKRVPYPLLSLANEGIVQWWVRRPEFLNWSGAEWYLRVRDWIYRNAGGG